MSEKIRLSNEGYNQPSEIKHEIHHSPETSAETKKIDAVEAAKHVESLQQKVEKLAETAEHTKHKHESHVDQGPKHHVLHQTHTAHTETQTIKRVQRQLKGAERQFSKIIHNPAVETVSDVTGATVARPSGLLIGSACSLIASILVLGLVKYYGYEYSFFVAIGSFAGGYILGICGEFVYRAFKSPAR